MCRVPIVRQLLPYFLLLLLQLAFVMDFVIVFVRLAFMFYSFLLLLESDNNRNFIALCALHAVVGMCG